MKTCVGKSFLWKVPFSFWIRKVPLSEASWRPSIRHLGKNSLSTTVFKGFDFIQCFNLVFQTQEINFRSKHFQMLISLYKVFVVCGEQSAHYYLLFALSNKFILEIENFCKNAVLKLRKFQKTVLQSGNCSKHAPDVGKSLPNWSSQSEMFKNETSNFKVYIYLFQKLCIFLFQRK